MEKIKIINHPWADESFNSLRHWKQQNKIPHSYYLECRILFHVKLISTFLVFASFFFSILLLEIIMHLKSSRTIKPLLSMIQWILCSIYFLDFIFKGSTFCKIRLLYDIRYKLFGSKLSELHFRFSSPVGSKHTQTHTETTIYIKELHKITIAFTVISHVWKYHNDWLQLNKNVVALWTN